jgi:hypothetical protein
MSNEFQLAGRKKRKGEKMNETLNSVTINGVEYIRKEAVKQTDESGYTIVRTYSAGVFAGYIKSRNGQEVVITNARRLWYWDGAASLSQLAVDGVANPSGCKFPCEVPEITLLNAIEIIPCTHAAMKSIKGVPIWKR